MNLSNWVSAGCALVLAACSGGSTSETTTPTGGEAPDKDGTSTGGSGSSSGSSNGNTTGGTSTGSTAGTGGGTTAGASGGSTAGATAGSTAGSTGGAATAGATGGSTGSAPIPDGGLPPADCSAGCATLVGHVYRQNAKPSHGGKGPLYFALFDGNPITGASTAKLVTATTLPNADLAADDAKVPYKLGPFAVTTKELQLMVFLDDDNNVDPSKPGPGKGDLVSLSLAGGIGGIKVKAATAGELTVDVPLTAAIP